MGKASSSKKVQKAAQAAASSRGASERRELGFPLTIAAIVVLGVALVVFARSERDASADPPSLRDHWHSAYAVYRCDEQLPIFTSTFDPQGIHSHQDGIIHVHPFSNAVTGTDATMAVFMEAMGAELDDDRLSGPGIGELTEDDTCDGEPAQLLVAKWATDDFESEPEVFTEDLDAVPFTADREAFVIGLFPEGIDPADIPLPGADRFAALDAVTGDRGTINDDIEDISPQDIEAPEGIEVPGVEPEPELEADAEAEAEG